MDKNTLNYVNEKDQKNTVIRSKILFDNKILQK